MASSSQATRVGDFELLAKIGEGGMGAVYRARQVSLDRIVALKILPRNLAANQEYLERFMREARATAKLNHPNIVCGIGVGCADGYHYFAMEYIEGTNLRRRILDEGRLEEDEILRIGAAVGSALAHAHAAGLVHRDVKPENILLDADGTPKLADLGLSKAAHETSSVTQHGAAVGTPHYMSPEQARGEPVIDGRADMYSLGCTLYHAATGQTPFDSNMPAVLMAKHLNDKFAHPQSLRPDLSDDFCAVLARLTMRERNERYPNMQAAAEDMEALLHGRPLISSAPPISKTNFLAPPAIAGSARGLRPPDRSRPKIAPVREELRGTRSLPRRRKVFSLTTLLINLTILGLLITGGVLIVLEALERQRAKEEESAKATPPSPQPHAVAQPTPTPSPTPTPEPVVPTPVAPKPPPAQPVSLFNGKDLSGWRMNTPDWSVEDGGLVGKGLDANAALACSNRLPPDFELTLEVTNVFPMYHFGWSSTSEAGGNFVLRNGTRISLTSYAGGRSVDLDKSDGRFTDGKHRFHIVCKGRRVRVYMDGALLLKTDDGCPPPLGKNRDLYIYSPPKRTTVYRDLFVRDLANETPAELK